MINREIEELLRMGADHATLKDADTIQPSKATKPIIAL